MRFNPRPLASLLALTAGLTSASAQCTSSWSILLGTIPPGRQNAAIAYDAARGKVTLFGGFDLLHFSLLDDTWVLSGENWTQTAVGGAAPTPRNSHALVYDSTRQRIVLFGGYDGVRKNDTWEWNGTAWAQVFATNPPPARQSHVMAYDSVRQRVVLFGGMDVNGALLGDTWELNPATAAWLQVNPAAAPSARSDSAMAFDTVRARCVLFGGQEAIGLNDNTWEWNGTAWAPFLGGTPPEARSGHTMVYDTSRHVCTLFGGTNFTAFLNDTWERTGTSWADITPATSPSPRYFHAMAFDAGRGGAVVYAGSNGNFAFSDTWARACACYANCDASTVAPILNVGDFVCFLNKFAAQDPYANCDGSTTPPTLNVLDFTCFLNRFAGGC